MDRDKIIETAYEACLGYEVDIDAVADYVEEILIAELKKARVDVAENINKYNDENSDFMGDVLVIGAVDLEAHCNTIIDQNKVDEG